VITEPKSRDRDRPAVEQFVRQERGDQQPGERDVYDRRWHGSPSERREDKSSRVLSGRPQCVVE
jgi:hypothetical protein